MDVLSYASDGNALLSFEPARELDQLNLDPLIPCPLALVALWKDQTCLLIRNRFRGNWELPGGMIDQGESAREAAVRELREETNQQAEDLTLAGLALYRLGPERRLEYGVVFTGWLGQEQPFVPNEEAADLLWWDLRVELDELDELDATLIRLTRPTVDRRSTNRVQ